MSCHPPKNTLRLLTQRLVVLLVCLTLGLHWALLQGIAWTGMLISFASEGAVIEAVQKTFDGKHGCALCAKVKEGRESDRHPPQQAGQTMKKIDAVLVETMRLIAPPAETIAFVPLHENPTQRNELPETPPPRRGQV